MGSTVLLGEPLREMDEHTARVPRKGHACSPVLVCGFGDPGVAEFSTTDHLVDVLVPIGCVLHHDGDHEVFGPCAHEVVLQHDAVIAEFEKRQAFFVAPDGGETERRVERSRHVEVERGDEHAHIGHGEISVNVAGHRRETTPLQGRYGGGVANNKQSGQLVVPVIDVSGWAAGDRETQQTIAAEVDMACRQVGFMQIVGHGIPTEAGSGLAGSIDEFFSLPMAVKSSYISPRSTINRGYSPPRSERLSYSLGVVTPDDLFEAYNVGANVDDFPHLAGELDADVYARNIWPAETTQFQRGVTEWFAAAGGVARTMTDVFACALGLAPGYFRQFTDHSIDVLRMNHYEVPVGIELTTGQLGMGAHTDYGIVTVLWADPVPGLEILRPDGSWLPVVPADGALLINLGDLLSRWTNDRWLSTMHRVVPPRNADGGLVRRRSAAYFHDGNADALISTLAPCRAADGSSSYRDVTVGKHLAQKLGGSRALELNVHAGREAGRITAARRASAQRSVVESTPGTGSAADSSL